jgi:phosphinothricin acetyltransferase
MTRVIRLAEERDAASVAAIYGYYVRETAITFDLVEPDAAAFAERFRDVLGLAPWLVCEDGGEITGYAYAAAFRERPAYRFTVETSVYVRNDARKRGVGSGLYADLIPRLVRQGFKRAIAGMTLPNPASAMLHAAFGFEPLGTFHHVGFKFGRWHDVQFWERALAPLEDAPRETLAVAR